MEIFSWAQLKIKVNIGKKDVSKRGIIKEELLSPFKSLNTYSSS